LVQDWDVGLLIGAIVSQAGERVVPDFNLTIVGHPART
jgi:hypothetical protein